MGLRRFASAVVVAVLLVAFSAPANARPGFPGLPWVEPFDDRITWHQSPTYTYEHQPNQSYKDWYRIRSSFQVDGLEPITDDSSVLVSFRGTGQFISAGEASSMTCFDNSCYYTTAFPAEWFPPPGTYAVNSVCRYYHSDGTKKCRAAYASEAVELVIPPLG